MGKSQRDKGARRERQMVDLLKDIGIKAHRVPLSGGMKMQNSLGEPFKDDIRCELGNWIFNMEVKARAKAEGWQVVKKWLGTSDMLALIEDRKDPLMVIPFHVFSELVARVIPKGIDDLFGGDDGDGEEALPDDEQDSEGDTDRVVPPL